MCWFSTGSLPRLRTRTRIVRRSPESCTQRTNQFLIGVYSLFELSCACALCVCVVVVRFFSNPA